MNPRSRPARSGLSPGLDPFALAAVTAVVLAGLLATGLRMAAAVPAPGGSRAATLSTAVRHVPAGARRSQPHGGTPATPGQASGLKLLTRAAQAFRAVGYKGVEVLAWWGADGISACAVEVWHQPGGQALTTAAPAGPDLPRATQRRAPAWAPAPSATLAAAIQLAMSQRLAALLAANYLLAPGGSGQVANRAAVIVTARRRDGGVAARFWLDTATGLPLRRQMFDIRGAIVSDATFTELTTMPAATMPAATMPAATGAAATGAAQAGPAVGGAGDSLASAQLAQLRQSGWPLPVSLPAHLTLLSASEEDTPTGPVVDLDYSDGLAAISIFVQRGHLPSQLGGWSQVALDGRRVYSGDPDDISVAWAARGYVYTLVSAAPRQTVGEVVAALPHDGAPTILGRIGRGLGRLVHLVSP